ncbi:Uncharacterised protein [Mycobacteroides abscessus subsp. bolletii]|nr:Uncharacterised protein [Mycobacteroides abscessus subsp. bolletii]
MAIRIAAPVRALRLGLQPPSHHHSSDAHHHHNGHPLLRRSSTRRATQREATTSRHSGRPTRRPPPAHPAYRTMGPPRHRHPRASLGRCRGHLPVRTPMATNLGSYLASAQPASTPTQIPHQPAARAVESHPLGLGRPTTMATPATTVVRRTHPVRSVQLTHKVSASAVPNLWPPSIRNSAVPDQHWQHHRSPPNQHPLYESSNHDPSLPHPATHAHPQNLSDGLTTVDTITGQPWKNPITQLYSRTPLNFKERAR